MPEKSYEEWGFDVIQAICDDKQVASALKVEEIRCVVNRDGHYPKSYEAGDEPSKAWQDELDAMIGG